ncbi:MAG TPA: SBBP repeat-containing protein, partial [Candidatus Cloacimonas sp.]|nr:SBBP repeat-containing protein [Candidatus Cloacimonas sp.]
MKKSFLLFILALCSIALFAQNEDWLWAKQAGGTSNDYGRSIAVDDNGNSYVTGDFAESATFGTTTLTSSGYDDIYVAKMDSNGNWLWAKQAGGTNYDYGYGIAVDAYGNSYVTGYFKSSSCSFGTITLINNNSEFIDIFAAKLD